ncbi:hypothetical protein Nepgr_008231 [Nepenthes gracilis]|uniref:Uncharacterized protein n=1 Tax=Nepenthes gracilis TaxID=150966 RepID=A0AAD3XJ90_NEPGR|nr:hypothetical protein Nepgr_008231 [Nepenthes gracilis]
MIRLRNTRSFKVSPRGGHSLSLLWHSSPSESGRFWGELCLFKHTSSFPYNVLCCFFRGVRPHATWDSSTFHLLFIVISMEESSSAFGSGPSSGGRETVTHASGIPAVAALEGYHSEATVVGPMSREGGSLVSTSGQGCRRRQNRVQVAVAEIKQLRARAAHFEEAWEESEARASRLASADVGASANIGARARILAFQEEHERLRRRFGMEVVWMGTELWSRFLPKEVSPTLEMNFQDRIRLSRKLVSLEDSNFHINLLDS